MRNGQVLKDRYRLTARIAAGGMGEVWRADDLVLHRSVAIKVLHAALASDPAFRRRFLQEARTLAALNAPGLIDLYDVCEERGEDGAPLSYLVMELIDGRTLAEVLAASGPMAPEAVMSVMAQAATALHAAHGAGIIHRDLKPANILVDAAGRVTVIDFGIARTRGHAALTSAGTVVGTVEYASPEQLRNEPLTPASDVYSLGVVGYECLTAVPPFHGESAASVMAAQLGSPPPPLPEGVPPAVAGVVSRALAKQPGERFGDAAEFAAACRAAEAAPHRSTRVMSVGHGHVPPPPTSVIEYAEPEPEPERSVAELLRRRTMLAVAATLGVVLLVAATVTVVWLGGRGDTGPTDDAGPSPSPSSPSPSPSPTGPDDPSTSTIENAHSGQCIGVEYFLMFRSSVLTDCESGDRFEFLPGTTEGVYQIALESEDGVCLNWRYGDEDVSAGDCGLDTAWRLTWVETRAGTDVWRIQSVNNSNYCLAIGEASPQGQDCTEDANQQWLTDAAAATP
ncbi:serine/threonine-protein kinase [Stackebrandtia albiflava]|uniref:non-specific serine/threonine protein kinase n=1 Tax=Stackebrandtia albiflava TaxID=406432 RepID=A0A562VAX1_9ACTN|nr:serine/threonine-protein kinase [Stackebrandtia albiflava]TWJ15022.1 serine/threonine-protein kinase [Stackebrandtia albiflava]